MSHFSKKLKFSRNMGIRTHTYRQTHAPYSSIYLGPRVVLPSYLPLSCYSLTITYSDEISRDHVLMDAAKPEACQWCNLPRFASFVQQGASATGVFHVPHNSLHGLLTYSIIFFFETLAPRYHEAIGIIPTPSHLKSELSDDRAYRILVYN